MGQIAVVVYVLLEIAALYCAWRAVSSARTSQSAVGWVVLLLAAPHIGLPLYLFLGHHKYRGYTISRRESERVIAGVRRAAEVNAPETPTAIDPKPFEQISALPAVRGNSFTPLIDGQATFQAIFNAIDGAESYILVQFYIVHDDELGSELKDRLIAAAKRGVSVRFMVDAIGSHALPESYYELLREAGVRVTDRRGSNRPKHRFQLNFRNHRKTVIVDGVIGFTGGLNVGDEYMGRDAFFGHWRDTHVALRGPIVAQLQIVFAEDWHWATGDTQYDELEWRPARVSEDMTGLIVATGPGDEMETGALFFFSAIAAAQKRLWIASPYCVPESDVRTALMHAAIRGVDVRLLLPEVVDHRIPWLAAFAYFDELRAAGVQIWRYNDGFMHQKVVLVDNDLAAIGTTNLDNRSFRLNFEAMAVVFDSRAAGEVATMLEADFSKAFLLEKQLADQSQYIRYGAPFARLFAPLL
ncbi:MAG: cardiolipin synthase [Pseudomonadota bacterium]